MRVSEEEIRKITLKAIDELGTSASPDLVKSVVSKAVEQLESSSGSAVSSEKTSGRILLTSFGLNQPGVVAALTEELGKADCDIQDLSQKLMGEFFTIIMIFDITKSKFDLSEVQQKMNDIATKLNVKIYLQHEDLFRQMHRI